MAQPAMKYPHSESLDRSELTAEVARVPGAPETWEVGALDMEHDGDIYIAIFSGPKALDRAREYAAAKYSDYEMR